jgi:hypothetical protein
MTQIVLDVDQGENNLAPLTGARLFFKRCNAPG